MENVRRSIVLAGCVMAATVAGGATAAAESTAATGVPGYESVIGSQVSGGAWWRAEASMDSEGMNYLWNGEPVHMVCYKDGQNVKPPNSDYESNRWFKVEVQWVSGQYFVHSSLVEDQINVGPC